MQYNTIVLERQFASGGREIAQTLSQRLNIPCYGQEILREAANQMGVTVAELAKLEESTTGSFLFSLYAFAKASAGESISLTKAQQLLLAESRIIQEKAANGPCIFLGRCAARALGDSARVLKVFIQTDYEKRLRRATDEYGHTQKEAERLIRHHDKKRADYYKATAGVDWRDPDQYHVILDSGVLGMDRTINILCGCVQTRQWHVVR